MRKTLSPYLFNPAVGRLSWVVWALVVTLTLPTVGLLWDGAWHMTFGRDTFWSPPHLLLYTGVTLSLLLSAAIVTAATFQPDAATNLHVGPLHAPLGAFMVLVGTAMMLLAAPLH